MAQPLATPYSYFADANGAPLSGGKVFTYAAGTTTPQNSYTDSSGVTPAANPVILDSAGRATIWLSGFYKIVVKDSLDNTLVTTDNITAYGLTGDMYKSVYDPANIQEQLLGLTAVQTATNKTFTGAVLAGTTNLTGGQIKFPATQVPSSDVNTLDDYEEGTWTPVFVFDTLGNLSITYSTQLGYYTKIGRLVIASFNIETSAFTWTTSSSSARVNGLPFSSGGLGYFTANSLYYQGITKASYTTFTPVVTATDSSLLIAACGSAQTQVFLAAGDFPTGGTVKLRGTVTYFV